MNTTLTIPTKIQNTAPKPTKSQLMEALLSRARAAHWNAEAIKNTKRDALEAEAEAIVRAGIKNVKPEDWSIDLRTAWGERPAHVSANFKSAKVESIQAKIRKLRSSCFDENATKAKIREGLKAPNPLLGNDDIVKSLDQLLATIMGQPKIETIEV